MRNLLILLILLQVLVGCGEKSEKDNSKLKNFDVTIDWVPSPEYYGFFYAKENRFYEDIGLNVKINYGSGAPVVANQIAAGAIYAGTTTSDNVLRQISRGANFTKGEPLLRFNPCVIASIKTSSINNLMELKGKILGTNRQSSVYQQLLHLIKIKELKTRDFNEYPIGYGGAIQLREKLVDAILAYTTNVVIDLEIDGLNVVEIPFDQWIKTYGLVLIIGENNQYNRVGLTENDITNFIEATKKGYDKGGEDIEGSIKALKKAEPTLKNDKIEKAIGKIVKLNKKGGYPINSLDQWVDEPDITAFHRAKASSLYAIIK